MQKGDYMLVRCCRGKVRVASDLGADRRRASESARMVRAKIRPWVAHWATRSPAGGDVEVGSLTMQRESAGNGIEGGEDITVREGFGPKGAKEGGGKEDGD